jgi:hypothetical protein
MGIHLLQAFQGAPEGKQDQRDTDFGMPVQNGILAGLRREMQQEKAKIW